MASWLEARDGRTIPLEGRCLLGRHHSCQLVLPDAKASRCHALLWRDQGGCWLVDLDSRNGTWLNGVRLLHPVRLKPGDEIRVGSHALKFHDAAAATRRAQAKAPPRPLSERTTEHAGEATAVSGHGALLLDGAGRVLSLTEETKRWLLEFFPAPQQPGGLPEALTDWLGEARARQWPLIVQQGERKLVARWCAAGEEHRVILFTEEQPAFNDAMLDPLGLTPRERETLRWIAAGKRNEEIAIILGLSPHTVKRHVERLLAKFNAENRSSLVAVVLDRVTAR